jgi:hypothetical protein
MTPADKLNLCGIVVTGAGSTIAMVGVYFQMNGYFAIKPRNILGQLGTGIKKFFMEGPTAAMAQLNIDATLGGAKKEDRGKSLWGFYLVLFGFLLQMIGSAFLLWALFAGGNTAG